MKTNTIKTIEDNITIREYEGWSINNTANSINFKNGIGHIIFVSDKEINELEILGIYHIIKHKANIYEGLDLNVTVLEGYYNKSIDRIFDYGNNYLQDGYITSVNNASNYLLNNKKELLFNSKSIIHIYYNAVPRYKKTKWWCFWNRRKCLVLNKAID